ncbi:hypothetical protein [Amycolatopsis sp. NPDC004079]|uniref:hypothetical protein n=1 Tax=Amycolatopsis sp. NPDC004079 TaxID=3154549 RepID=UPI0033B81B85
MAVARLTARIYETQKQDVVDGSVVWTTPAEIVNADGEVVAAFSGPVSEEWLQGEWDAALAAAGYKRVSEWNLTWYTAFVEEIR